MVDQHPPADDQTPAPEHPPGTSEQKPLSEVEQKHLSAAEQKPLSAAEQKHLSEAEQKQRKRRNVAIALMIIGFVLLVYMVTILRLGSSIAERTF